MTPNPERYATLRTRAREAAERLRQYQIRLSVRYGSMSGNTPDHYLKAAERRKRDQLKAACDRHDRAMYAYVEAISPRAWDQGVPYTWIVHTLTFDDAVTRGALSVVPPPAWGFGQDDTRRIAQPVQEVRA
jgi:hypothetical protein